MTERWHKYMGYPALVEIAKLESNWDSYDGLPIDDRCLEHAFAIMRMMPHWWTPVPCSDGSMQLERHAGGMDFTLSISTADTTGASPEPWTCKDCGQLNAGYATSCGRCQDQ